MTDITSTDLFSQYGFSTTSSTTSTTDEDNDNSLGQDEFLELMITELENQDPTDPSDSSDFIAELAQFSTVESLEEISDTINELSTSFQSSQALQASSLVGGNVTIDGNNTSTLYWGDLVYGSADISAGATDLSLQITNSSGQVVENVSIGNQSSGDLSFKWDGANLEVNGELMEIDYDQFETDEDGSIIPHEAGEYTFTITGSVAGATTSMNVNTSQFVESVTILDDGTIQLNLDNGEPAYMTDVASINETA
ncbi:flagellar hook assembly protein FlgD [Reinekea marinisedimentorum]|uniref:Basal-body rod modification protein FlgD n=1 Tax=Reinekea marinisedimentorum TaxID=230495 RepID=A0A4R3I748_9GAMM|nr:flagellar hook capping FlgD N-terminal domain-containing protein [Reinekea marinisedimentorum]TCS39919.1 flagellar basal-body rod modification protein FlgD [Reinekea marinisedimentorum]